MASFSNRQEGFSYLGLLFLLAIIGLSSAALVQMSSLMQRRAAEEELLSIGLELRGALISYANATPPGQRTTPSSFEELLKDSRYPLPRRHLRKRYLDPLTNGEEWGVVLSQDGKGIEGFYSLSKKSPIKVGNFDAPFRHFSGKNSYEDWRFNASLRSDMSSQ